MNAKRVLFVLVLLTICQGAFAQTPVWTQMPGSPSGATRHDDICFVNETNGFSARGRGGIFKTTDAGNTWVQKTNMPGTHFRAIGFLSPTRGFAGNLGVGSYDGAVSDTNVLYQTVDGGETWSVVPGINETGMKGSVQSMFWIPNTFMAAVACVAPLTSRNQKTGERIGRW